MTHHFLHHQSLNQNQVKNQTLNIKYLPVNEHTQSLMINYVFDHAVIAQGWILRICSVFVFAFVIVIAFILRF